MPGAIVLVISWLVVFYICMLCYHTWPGRMKKIQDKIFDRNKKGVKENGTKK
jgi:hypothetical protein